MSATTIGAGVPFLDLAPAHEELREAILDEIAALVKTGAFTNGPAVELFENAFASYCGVHHCVGLASGLDALRLALLALDLAPGDEVIVPAMTFVATFEAVTQAGATPVVADVAEGDYGLDPAAAEAALSARTRALLPVHLYGQLADLRRLTALADRVEVALVEDACQAHGAERDGHRAGASASAGAFSFYPGKNLGAFGDAGALVTNDDRLATLVRALREHGQRRKYEHAFEGYTARLDTLQAVVLLKKLDRLDQWNEQRRDAAAFYGEALADVGDLRLPLVCSGSEPVWHLYVVRTADPTGLASHLADLGIGTGRHYPQPPHLAPAYARLGYKPGAFPVAEALAREALSLPLFPGITEAQLDAVVTGVVSYFSRG